jgi:hypothetical protein
MEKPKVTRRRKKKRESDVWCGDLLQKGIGTATTCRIGQLFSILAEGALYPSYLEVFKRK